MNLSAEFPLEPGLVYLNHAAVAPWPRRTADAVSAFARENMTRGALDYPRWNQAEAQLRHRAARLLNAPSPEDIALLKNTSEALSLVAHGLPWENGDNIVSCVGEFPSNRIVWQALAGRGVQLRLVDIYATPDPEAALMEACDGRTRLLAISSVQYATGLRLDLERLGAFCRQRGILFCIDAIQSLGATQFDLQACNADFVMADGHKWMLAPEGLALFYCRPELREQLRLCQFGWHMVEHQRDFDRQDWKPAASARRFECGSPNMLCIQALSASLSLLLEVGRKEVEQLLLERSDYLMERIRQTPGLDLVTPRQPDRHAGIVTFRPRDIDPATLLPALFERRVVCAQRGGGIRFSPHFYTPLEVLDEGLERTRDAIRTLCI